MIIALSGRRVDAADAPVRRFPSANEAAVRARLEDLFAAYHPRAVVASAAAGADLIGLEVAGAVGARRVVIVPFAPERFREASVTDRGAEWGPRFDRVREELPPQDLIVDPAPSADESDEHAYLRVVHAVLETALDLARAELAQESNTDAAPASRVVAVVLWEGASRGPDDMSAAFVAAAKERGIHVERVDTLDTR